jgi:MFS family permease
VFVTTLATFAGFALATYNVNTGLAGLVAGVFVVGGAVGRLFAGRYLELAGRRRMVLLSALLFFVLGMGYSIPVEIGVFIVLRFFHGVSYGCYHTTISTIVISLVSPAKRGEGMGYFTTSFVLATAVGPFVGLFLIRQFSYQALFVACSIFAFLSLLFLLFMKIPSPTFLDEERASLTARLSLKDLFEKTALPIAIILVLLNMCYAGVTAFLDSFTTELGLSGSASTFFVVYATVVIIVRPLAGRLFDKKGDNTIMLPAMVVFVFALLAIGFTHSLLLLVVAALLMAVSYGTTVTTGQVIAVAAAPPHRIGTATSTFFIFADLGHGIGPLLMGLIAMQGGFSFLYVAEAGIVALTLLLYYILHGRSYHQKKHRRNS